MKQDEHLNCKSHPQEATVGILAENDDEQRDSVEESKDHSLNDEHIHSALVLHIDDGADKLGLLNNLWILDVELEHDLGDFELGEDGLALLVPKLLKLLSENDGSQVDIVMTDADLLFAELLLAFLNLVYEVVLDDRAGEVIFEFVVSHVLAFI